MLGCISIGLAEFVGVLAPRAAGVVTPIAVFALLALVALLLVGTAGFLAGALMADTVNASIALGLAVAGLAGRAVFRRQS